MGFPTTTEISFCSLKIPNLSLRMTAQLKNVFQTVECCLLRRHKHQSLYDNSPKLRQNVISDRKGLSFTWIICQSRIQSTPFLVRNECKNVGPPSNFFLLSLALLCGLSGRRILLQKCGKRLWMTMTYGEYSKHFSQYLRQTLLCAQNCTHSWSKKKTAQNSLGHPFTQKISFAYIFRNYYQWKTEMTQSPGCWRTSWVHE